MILLFARYIGIEGDYAEVFWLTHLTSSVVNSATTSQRNYLLYYAESS